VRKSKSDLFQTDTCLPQAGKNPADSFIKSIYIINNIMSNHLRIITIVFHITCNSTSLRIGVINNLSTHRFSTSPLHPCTCTPPLLSISPSPLLPLAHSLLLSCHAIHPHALWMQQAKSFHGQPGFYLCSFAKMRFDVDTTAHQP